MEDNKWGNEKEKKLKQKNSKQARRKMLKTDVPEEIRHGMVVSNIAYRVAKTLECDEQMCYDMAVAGIVHDIGKIRLAGHIYGRDDDALKIQELRYIRMHSKLSYDILKERDFSEMVCETVLYHHENYDGSGYPYNLRGDEIPYGARILRICDVFSALVAERPYRKAFDVETALELMIEEVKNFDMKIFLAFMQVIHEFDVEEFMYSIS